MTAAISAASTSFSSACWRIMSSWCSGRVSSWIAWSNVPLATSTPTRDPDRRATAPTAASAPPPAPSLHRAQLLDQGGQRPLEVLDRAVVRDHVLGPRGLLLLGELARLALVDQGVAARLGALAAHLLGGDDGDGRVEDALHARPRTAAAPRPRRSRCRPGSEPSQAPIRSPTSGWICGSSQVSCSGSAKTISPIRSRSTRPSGATSAPQRSTRRPSSGSESSSSWTTASLEIVAAPSRAKAASASDFPAAMPPVRPIVSGIGRR